MEEAKNKSIDLFSIELDEASTKTHRAEQREKCVFCLLSLFSKSQYWSKDYWLGVNWALAIFSACFIFTFSLSRLFNTCSRHWNCLQLKQHTSPRLKHATLSTIKSPNPTAVPHLDDPPRRRHKNTWKIIIPLNRKLNKFFAAAGVFGNLFYDPSQWCLFHITRTQ